MGVWNIGIMENDEAKNFLQEFKDVEDPTVYLNDIFDNAEASQELKLAAAGVIAMMYGRLDAPDLTCEQRVDTVENSDLRKIAYKSRRKITDANTRQLFARAIEVLESCRDDASSREHYKKPELWQEYIEKVINNIAPDEIDRYPESVL